MTYIADLEAAAAGARKALKKREIDPARLKFGGAGDVPKTIRAPSFADSKFQAEQALGDWAEGALAAAINDQVPGYRAVHYGFSSKLVAGEPGFKEQYENGIKDTCVNGKRADLLLVPSSVGCPDDVSEVQTDETKDLVSKSIGAIEVRSSRLEAYRYMAYQKEQLELGKKKVNLVPNFTVKIEDLIIVYRWIELFKKPQAYAQVFLDTVFGISVLDIMRYIAGADKLQIEDPKRSGKLTIFIPVTEGIQLGEVTGYPDFEVVDRITKNGRHDIYAKPSGGAMTIDPEKVLSLLKH